MNGTVLGGAALVVALVAAGVAFSARSGNTPTPVVPAAGAGADTRIAVLERRVEEQGKRIETLERDLALARDEAATAVRSGRGALPPPPSGVVPPTMGQVEMAVARVVADAGSGSGTPDPALVQAIAAEVRRAEAERDENERLERQAAERDRWAKQLQEKLDLSPEQVPRVAEVLAWRDARRADMRQTARTQAWTGMDRREAFSQLRKESDEKMSAVLTPSQMSRYQELEAEMFRPPAGPPR